jgi:hypothetical protein
MYYEINKATLTTGMMTVPMLNDGDSIIDQVINNVHAKLQFPSRVSLACYIFNHISDHTSAKTHLKHFVTHIYMNYFHSFGP